jgi:aminoglycoside phosphotransferase (APT) family kinase protein
VNGDELRWVAKVAHASSARTRERIQSLWSGYGEILRVELHGAAMETVIVKSVRPPARARASATDAGHARKCRSYAVETAWYRTFAAQCDFACRVPRLHGSTGAKDAWLFVLEDLDAAGFAERRRDPDPAEIYACLSWLASFHARFLGVAPRGLWKTGTYWHLATRLEELAQIDDVALREAAPLLDQKLGAASFQTLVHGDAKPANFCFARDGGSVAAVDFQYVGGGCGMKDVAYLLSGGSGRAAEATEARHLDTYFALLRAALADRAVDASALEREWRALYPLARADYHRFLAGWARDHFRRDAYAQDVSGNELGESRAAQDPIAPGIDPGARVCWPSPPFRAG